MALSLLVLTILVLSTPLEIASEILKCDIPKNFSLLVYHNLNVEFHDAELQVDLDYDNLRFYGYKQDSFVSVRAKNVTVDFKADATHNYLLAQRSSDPRNTDHIMHDELTGVARRTLLNDTTYIIYNCRLTLLPAVEETSATPMIIRNQIRRLAESCVELHVCEKFSKINQWNFIDTAGISQPCLLPSTSASLADAIAQTPYEPGGDLGSFQSVINKVIDVTLADALGSVKNAEGGTITLPNIMQTFSTKTGIFNMTGQFEATNGTFQNLTTLRRNKDVIVSKIGNKYEISCGIELRVAKLQFPRYKLKYAGMTVRGSIDGSINGVQAETAVSVDYSQMPCVQKVERVQVTQLGTIQVDVIGLWPLNYLLTKLVEFVTRHWKGEIVSSLEGRLGELVYENWNKFDCEKYRP